MRQLFFLIDSGEQLVENYPFHSSSGFIKSHGKPLTTSSFAHFPPS